MKIAKPIVKLVAKLIGTVLITSILITPGVAEDVPRVSHLMDDSGDRVPVSTTIPAYPKNARRDRIEGEVQVCFNVDRKGRPYRISVRRSTNRVFERPAMRAIRASSYRPLPPEARPSGIKTCRTFRFTLEPETADTAE